MRKMNKTEDECERNRKQKINVREMCKPKINVREIHEAGE